MDTFVPSHRRTESDQPPFVQHHLTGNEPPAILLEGMLSIRSVISTTSTFAALNQEAASDDVLQTFSAIGSGSCGTVFEQIGTVQIVKRAIHVDSTQLWNEYIIQKRMEEAFEARPVAKSQATFTIPRSIQFVSSKDTAWWENNAHRFPAQYQIPSNLLLSERIMPLPKVIREALIHRYCRDDRISTALKDPVNRACLVRLYLGKIKSAVARPSMFFTLRNFPLHLDQMVDLNLDVEAFSRYQAVTLAVMHYVVHIDARDVEFVLGSAPIEGHYTGPDAKALSGMKPNSSTHPQGGGVDFQHRLVQPWVIDFNMCQDITPNEAGIDMAVQAFMLNDPYFPRPHIDAKLWGIFIQTYLRSGLELCKNSRNANLPYMFTKKLESEMQKQATLVDEAAARTRDT